MLTKIEHGGVSRKRYPSVLLDQRGVAMATVVLLGAVLVLMATVVALRAYASSDRVETDRKWEQALYTAESGIDVALVESSADSSWNTGESAADLVDRADVIAAADARSASELIASPEGDLVLVKPADGDAVYAVGFSPSRDAVHRQVRIVEAAFEPKMSSFTPTMGFVTGSDLLVDSNNPKTVSTGGNQGRIHANGKVTTKNGPKDDVRGCVTHTGGGGYTSGDISENPDCPTTTPIDPVPIPVVDPLRLHSLAHYDFCYSGAHYGPAHSSPLAGTAGTPCSGGIATDLPFNVNPNTSSVALDEGLSAVFFSWGRDVSLKVTKPDVAITIIAAKLDNTTSCGLDSYGGSIDVLVSKDASLVPHPSAENATLIAAADLDLKISGIKKTAKGAPGTIVGFLAAGEQVALKAVGNVDVDNIGGAVRGAVIAVDTCDTNSSPVHTTAIQQADLFYSGEVGTTLLQVASGELQVAYLTER